MLDAPNIIKINGQELKYEGLTGEVQSAFEKYMHFKILELLKENRDALGAEYHEFVMRHLNQVKAGLLTVDSEQGIAFLKDNEHVAQLFWLCLSKHQLIPRENVVAWIKSNIEDARAMFNNIFESKKEVASADQTASSS